MAKYVVEIDSILSLRRRGYWDPKVFPTVAAFAGMSTSDQNELVVTCKRQGFAFAVEAVPKSTVVEDKQGG